MLPNTRQQKAQPSRSNRDFGPVLTYLRPPDHLRAKATHLAGDSCKKRQPPSAAAIMRKSSSRRVIRSSFDMRVAARGGATEAISAITQENGPVRRCDAYRSSGPTKSETRLGHQGDGVFGTDGDAESAPVTLIRPGDVGRHPAVGRGAELAQHPKSREVPGGPSAALRRRRTGRLARNPVWPRSGRDSHRSGCHRPRIRSGSAKRRRDTLQRAGRCDRTAAYVSGAFQPGDPVRAPPATRKPM